MQLLKEKNAWFSNPAVVAWVVRAFGNSSATGGSNPSIAIVDIMKFMYLYNQIMCCENTMLCPIKVFFVALFITFSNSTHVVPIPA